MENYMYAEMINNALTAPSRSEYIDHWLSSSLWGEWEDGCVPPAVRAKIISYLGKVWDVCHMSVRDMYMQSGMPQAVLASFLGVPARTMNDWCTGTRVPPPHVHLMIARLMRYMPSYMSVLYEINKIRQNNNQKIIAPMVQIKRKKVSNMNSVVQVKDNTIAEAVISIQDLVYSGVQIDTDKIEAAGLRFEDLPPLYLMAKIETDENGNDSINYYYSLKDYGNIHSAFGEVLENSIYDTPKEALAGWMYTILDAYVLWQDLAEDMYGPDESVDADEATKKLLWDKFNQTKKNCLFYEKEGKQQSLLNEIGVLRGIASCLEPMVGQDQVVDADFLRLLEIQQKLKGADN